MEFSSLPDYPTDPANRAARFRTAGWGLSPRAMRVLRDLRYLLLILVLLYWLRRTATAIENRPAPLARPPLMFQLVQEKFGQVRLLTSYEEVEELLGPPTPTLSHIWQADLWNWLGDAEQSYRHLIPEDRYWRLWTDPQDESRGVAILFAAGKVYSIRKKGF